MPTVRANDIDIAYSDQGSGDVPIVLLHGFPLDKRMWEGQAEALSSEFRVIAPDLRGHGESQVTPGPYTMESLADDLNAFLDALGLGQVTLGGFSMGGYVAFAFYRKHPERVANLMLLDTRPQPDSEEAKGAGRPWRSSQRARVEQPSPSGSCLACCALTRWPIARRSWTASPP